MRLSTRYLAIVSSLSYMNTAKFLRRVGVRCDVIFLVDNLARLPVTGIEFFFVNDLSGKRQSVVTGAISSLVTIDKSPNRL